MCVRTVQVTSIVAAWVMWIAAGSARATTYTWTGAGAAPKSYLDPANWSPGGFPNSADATVFSIDDTVYINGNWSGAEALISGSLTATQSGDYTWYFGTNSNLEILSDGTLTLAGGLNVNVNVPT